MNKSFIYFLFVSMFVAVIAFLASNNIFVGVGILVLYLLYFVLLANKKLRVYKAKNERIHCCYHFINSFLISMSVKDSLDESYLSATQSAKGEFKSVIDELNDMDTLDKMEYLRKYFNLAIYKMFLDVIKLYLDQGGSLLTMADSIMLESTRIEETLNKSNSSSKRSLMEFIVLWVLSIAVLLFMRFMISDFYLIMLKSLVFLIILIIFFVLILLSIHIFIVRFTNIYVKEDKI